MSNKKTVALLKPSLSLLSAGPLRTTPAVEAIDCHTLVVACYACAGFNPAEGNNELFLDGSQTKFDFQERPKKFSQKF